ncbi:MAG: sugar phosphate isomerase/epimerase [Planctomycetaceae bacterium]|nr:sugar phosphate isomerase/epimerase [Planctomycetaceae bacterium]
MKVGFMTNAWGTIYGGGGGVTSIVDSYYISTGPETTAFPAIAAAGFEYVELFEGNLIAYEGRMNQLADLLAANNLHLLGVYTGLNFIFEDALAEELAKVKRVLGLAREAGAKHLCVGGGAVRHDGIREGDYKLVASGLDAVKKMADDFGIIASIHPHMGSAVQSPEQLDKVMAMTGIDICPDCGHVLLGGGDPLAVVKKYLDRIKYIHLKDVRDGAAYPPGYGEIDFDAILSVLKATGRHIDYTVEIDGYPGTPEDGAAKAYGYLQDKIA